MSLVIKPFHLLRHTDVSGLSGTGVVAVGAVYPNGKAVMHWVTYRNSFEIHDSLDNLIELHGHSGSTEVIFGPLYDPASTLPAKPKRPRKKKSNG